jgi:hypothetical protein
MGNNLVTHAKKVDHLVGYDALRRQFGDGNIENAANPCGEKQKQRGIGADPRLS